MLFLVRMDVHQPANMPLDEFNAIRATEREYSRDLQRTGAWPHIWRVAGGYSNYSIFDVESNDALHDVISRLPLFSYMDVQVTALAHHPSDIH